MKKNLDFCIIGAQKSATTSLHYYLAEHPQIYLPPDKEANFFSFDSRFNSGWESYLKQFFSHASDNLLWGKNTPTYMTDQRVPQRIANTIPNIKLIAILRDPIQRAFSHYKMCKRRGLEHRSFEEAILEQLTEENLNEARDFSKYEYCNEPKCYVVWGEYGRILKQYYDYFSSDNILVLRTKDLAIEPEKIYQQICNFLYISSDKIPKNISKKYHVGGEKTKFPSCSEIKKNFPVFNMFWKLIPKYAQRQLEFRYEIWNVGNQTKDKFISQDIKAILEKHYEQDSILLKKLANVQL